MDRCTSPGLSPFPYIFSVLHFPSTPVFFHLSLAQVTSHTTPNTSHTHTHTDTHTQTLSFNPLSLTYTQHTLSHTLTDTLYRSIADCFKEAHESYADIPEVATQIRKGAALCRQQLMESTKMLRKVSEAHTFCYSLSILCSPMHLCIICLLSLSVSLTVSLSLSPSLSLSLTHTHSLSLSLLLIA